MTERVDIKEIRKSCQACNHMTLCDSAGNIANAASKLTRITVLQDMTGKKVNVPVT